MLESKQNEREQKRQSLTSCKRNVVTSIATVNALDKAIEKLLAGEPFSLQLRTKGARNCASISSIYMVHVHVAFFSLNGIQLNHVLRLHGVRCDDIMFLQSSVQSCIRIAELKSCGVHRKKGWLFDISSLLGLYAGLIIVVIFLNIVVIVIYHLTQLLRFCCKNATNMLMIKGDVYLNAGEKLSPYVQSHGDSDFYVYSESGFSVHQIHTSAAFHAEKTGQKIGQKSGGFEKRSCFISDE